MDKITQEAYFRQRVLKYAAEHGVTASANRYRLSRKTVHKWKGRYDGTLGSLKDRPRTPHHSPRKQTAEEEKLVQRYARKYRGDLLLGYEKACARGYRKKYHECMAVRHSGPGCLDRYITPRYSSSSSLGDLIPRHVMIWLLDALW